MQRWRMLVRLSDWLQVDLHYMWAGDGGWGEVGRGNNRNELMFKLESHLWRQEREIFISFGIMLVDLRVVVV